MKTKITLCLTAFFLAMTVHAQTIVYDDATASGIFFDGNGAEEANPLSDAVNSSTTVANSGTAGAWQKIQYFPTYTPVSGDKLFFSVYDPSNVGTAQVKFEYTGSPGVWEDGGDVGYVSGTDTGWQEQSISLTPNAGNEINKIIIMPGYNTSNAVYVDNIYFGQESILSTSSTTIVYDETTNSGMFFQGNGAEVSNPLSDTVNSSANVAQSGTGGSWQQIQYFPTFTPSTGDKLFFSVYDPSNVGTAQVKFEYTSNPGVWEDGGDVGYVSGTDTGWQEQSISLTPNAGNEINKIIIMPGYNTSNAVYVDNIYFGQESILSTSSTTIVYDETTNSGMFFQGNGAEVSNPLSDTVNSSANVAQSGTGGSWQQIQYFPTFTPSTGDKLFFSVYDPSNVGTAQVKFEYTSNPGVWEDGGDVGYVSGTDTGWQEQSISLTPNAGNEINKIIIMPGYNTSNAVYVDNIYFGQESIIVAPEDETYFFREGVENSTIFHSGTSEVANPLSDAINSSSISVQNAGSIAWEETQFFPVKYTIQSGDKIFISYYNPNVAAAWQLRMDLSVSGSFIFIGEPAHDSAALTGWHEVYLDLSAYAGEDITKIQLYPAAGESTSIYFDNVYISANSTLSNKISKFVTNKAYISNTGTINFFNTQNNTKVSVFDLTGRKVFNETINGKSGERMLSTNGIYILRIETTLGVFAQKAIFMN